MPRNAGTGRSYSGINVLILWGCHQHGFPCQSWLTFRERGNNILSGDGNAAVAQAGELGGLLPDCLP
jgi:antirestriction protein ArdC